MGSISSTAVGGITSSAALATSSATPAGVGASAACIASSTTGFPTGVGVSSIPIRFLASLKISSMCLEPCHSATGSKSIDSSQGSRVCSRGPPVPLLVVKILSSSSYLSMMISSRCCLSSLCLSFGKELSIS